MTNRTRAESLRHMKSEYEACRLGAYAAGACRYVAGARHCAAGALLSEGQLAVLTNLDLLSASIGRVADVLGHAVIHRTTGMSVDELNSWQIFHDADCARVAVADRGTAFYREITKEINAIQE